VNEKDWSSVDPAPVDALRKLVAVLGDARSLGPVRLQPRGLVNTGNSCFMNCTLQVRHNGCLCLGLSCSGTCSACWLCDMCQCAAERVGQHGQQLLHEL
jgi:hypothetical protein